MGSDDLFKKRRAKTAKHLKRKSNIKNSYEKVLIVCEGEKSEVYYLESFRDFFKLSQANIYIDPNSDSSPSSVVKYAISLAKQSKDDPFDKVFCLFDRDLHSDFHNALELIIKNKDILVKKGVKSKLYGIISNPCFEFWILLHFKYTAKPYKNVGSPCNDLIKIDLNPILITQTKQSYSKVNKNFYRFLIEKQYYKTAISNAKRLYKELQKVGNKAPQTNFFVLIECLESIKNNQCKIIEPIKNYYIN